MRNLADSLWRKSVWRWSLMSLNKEMHVTVCRVEIIDQRNNKNLLFTHNFSSLWLDLCWRILQVKQMDGEQPVILNTLLNRHLIQHLALPSSDTLELMVIKSTRRLRKRQRQKTRQQRKSRIALFAARKQLNVLVLALSPTLRHAD